MAVKVKVTPTMTVGDLKTIFRRRRFIYDQTPDDYMTGEMFPRMLLGFHRWHVQG